MDAIGTQRSEKLLRATKRLDKDDLWGNAGSPLDGIPSKRCATLGLSRGLRMDDGTSSISPLDLYARLGSELAPTVIDVRRDPPRSRGRSDGCVRLLLCSGRGQALVERDPQP